MTAGSWIYIGTQGILQGTYETFGSLARQQGWPSLRRNPSYRLDIYLTEPNGRHDPQ